MIFTNYTRQGIKVGAVRFNNGVSIMDGVGFPKSGTGFQYFDVNGQSVPVGSLYVDKSTGVVFKNEGTSTAPYWTPVSFNQQGLYGWHTDFRDGVGVAGASTAASTTLDGSGLRVHGQGIEVNDTDNGLVVTFSDQGAVGQVLVTNEDQHTTVLSFGTGTTPLFQPDQNGTIVLDVNIAQETAITNRSTFVGFCGSAADALDPVVTSSGTTISFAATIGDDVAGFYRSVDLTDTAGWMFPYDKGNANASIATTASQVDTGQDQAAAGTYQRLRVEVDADGGIRGFINKVQYVTLAAGTLDVDEEIHPIVMGVSEGANATSFLVKHLMAYGVRP